MNPTVVQDDEEVDSLEFNQPNPGKEKDPSDNMIPDYSFANCVGGGGSDQCKGIDRVMTDWFKEFCELKPNEWVLEAGCGIGRIAIPFTQYLSKRGYVGFDIIRHGLEWCQQKFTTRCQPAARLSSEKTVDFTCNVCGRPNRAVPTEFVQNREYPSCSNCRSSLRMRSVMYALAMELFGKPYPLPGFPVDKTINGLGMSDWEGYASGLKMKFAYVNTYYHTEPRLDITDIAEERVGKNRFLISSDVFEHIPVDSLDQAFRNSRRLLKDRGVLIFTAPFTKTGRNQEHFPRLHDFRVIETRGKHFLYNKTADGAEEIFDDLIFHGGGGMTLEMRVFSEPDLRQAFEKAGFSSIRIYPDIVSEFGILWPMDWAVPIAARA